MADRVWRNEHRPVSTDGVPNHHPRRAPRRTALVLALMVIAAPLSGCGMSQGEALYFLGVGRRAKVEAKFRLTRGPVLILVDDVMGRVDWPMATRYLVDDLSQALIKTDGADRIVPRRTLENLRRADADFDEYTAHEIARRAGADQVLWIEVQDYFGDIEFHEAVNAAYFSVTVKVLNALETESRSNVRLWPSQRQGHYMTVSLSAPEVSMAKTKDAIARALSAKLSDAIAKLFHDYRPDDNARDE